VPGLSSKVKLFTFFLFAIMRPMIPTRAAVLFPLLALCLALFLCACDSASTSAASSLPTAQVRLGGQTFTLEIANKDEDRFRGLMYRDAMPADHGMIFVFPDVAPRSFWMKNTRIPLDILYLDGGGKVISIHQMKPYVLAGTPSDGPAKYAIELNAGAAAKAGVHVGDHLMIPPAAREAADGR
jgi:uncharacterized membrane protein (UPF0127 family)